jgi:hypothetical protein
MISQVCHFNITPSKTKTAKNMYEFILKRPHWEGERNAACCLNIPRRFVQQMGLDRQTYLMVTYDNDEQKLIVQKLVEGGLIDNK